jgi:hypothetical protein
MRDKVLSTLALSFALAMSATAGSNAYARGGGGGGGGGPATASQSGTAHPVGTPTVSSHTSSTGGRHCFGGPAHCPSPVIPHNTNTAGNKPINCKPGGGGCMRQP